MRSITAKGPQIVWDFQKCPFRISRMVKELKIVNNTTTRVKVPALIAVPQTSFWHAAVRNIYGGRHQTGF